MADATPADAVEGQEPDAGEGQEPDNDAPDGKGPRQYPESYVRQLRREAAAQRNRVAELEEKIEEIAGRDKSEQERLFEKLTATERRATEAETKLLRLDVAAEAGLDIKAVKFLTGSTREEMELHAAELAELLAEKQESGRPAAVSTFDGGARTQAPPKGPPEEAHNDFLMRALGRAHNR